MKIPLLIVATFAGLVAVAGSAQVAPVQPTTLEVTDVGAISPETAAALEAAKRLMSEQKFEEAAAEYEKAMVALPDNASLKLALSQAYSEAGDTAKAIEPLIAIYKADPHNSAAAIRLAVLFTEDAHPEKAKKILDALPLESVTDPAPFISLGVDFMNKGKGQDAWNYFDKAVKVAPEAHEGYYYRALSEMQMHKNDAARVDLKKVIELAADSDEAKDAKDLLAELE
jgi:tetratricopeptide (TPR) repeat protein